MTHPAATPYVVIWREPPSPRLRTYVDDITSRPIATPLSNITPPPTLIVDDPTLLDELLSQDPNQPFTAAIAASLVTSHLGWDVTETDDTTLSQDGAST